MPKEYPKFLILIAVVFIFAAAGYGYWDYQKITKSIAEADVLVSDKKYDEALAKLEPLQKDWLVKGFSFKKDEIGRRVEENTRMSEDEKNYEQGTEKIKQADWTGAKDLLVKISDKSSFYQDAQDKIAILSQIIGCQHREGKYEMRVTDSKGRVTGLINGKVKEEIPNSFYDEESGAVSILFQNDSYIYDFHAVSGGNYQFTLNSLQDGQEKQYYLENIPIPAGGNHRVELDQNAQDGKRGLLSIDNNGDGLFEKEIRFGEKLTCQEYIARTELPGIEIDFGQTSDNPATTTPSAPSTTTAAKAEWEKTYSYPYEISWQDKESTYSMKYDLTRVTVADDVLTLYFKINKVGQTGSGVCPRIDMRMELNEEGDFRAPVTSAFDADCFWDNQTYYNQRVIFSVADTQKKFIILTKNDSNLVLTITLLSAGKIQVEKSLTGG
jgi:hypothetical protein